MGEGFIVRKGGGIDAEFATSSGDPSSLDFIRKSGNFGGIIDTMAVDSSFIYVGGFGSIKIRKYHRGNLALVATQGFYNGQITSLSIDDNFIYVGGRKPNFANGNLEKYHKGNLAIATLGTVDTGALSTKVDGSFLYTGGIGGTVSKWHKSNLTLVGTSNSYGATIRSIDINNSFVYAVGSGPAVRQVKRWHIGNLVFSANSVNLGQDLTSIKVESDFIYVGGGVNVQKLFLGNLTQSIGSEFFGSTIEDIALDNEFVYAGGRDSQTLKKYYKSNLAFVGNTNTFDGLIFSVVVDNDFIYAGVTFPNFSNGHVQQHRKQGLPDPQGIIIFDGNTYVKQ